MVQKDRSFTQSSKLAAGLSVGVGLMIALGVVGAVIAPCFAQNDQIDPKKSKCQSNMKELALAFNMYCGDYDGKLPSSYLYGRSRTWSKPNFIKFAKEQGTLPPSNAKKSTLTMILYPYMKNKDVVWCPSDPARRDDPSAAVSYYYKAAIDRAWYGDKGISAQNEGDFEFPADQIMFWEHNGWHWGDADKGVTNGVKINAAFLDGHVAVKTIHNSGYMLQENPPEPLPNSNMGEPAWFNCNMLTGKCSTGTHWNPQVYGDNLQP